MIGLKLTFLLFISFKNVFSVSALSKAGLFATNSNGTKICVKNECIHAASRFLESIDTAVNPCDNFYKFACGGFFKKAIPNNEALISSFQNSRIATYKKINQILVAEQNEFDSEGLSKARLYYKACMNTTKIQRAGLKPLMTIIKQLGGFPVLEGESWKKSNFDWKEVTRKLRDIGFSHNYLIRVEVGPNLSNNSQKILTFQRPSLKPPTEFISDYEKYLKNIALFLGADEQVLDNDLTENMAFEKLLRGLTKIPKISIKLLFEKQFFPEWKTYTEKLMPPGMKIDANQEIYVDHIYMMKFNNLIRTVPERVQANYIMWRVILQAVPFLSDDIRSLLRNYENASFGVERNKERWLECTHRVNDAFVHVLGIEYLKRHFHEEDNQYVFEIFKDLKQALQKILRKVDWMDDETKTRAFTKLQFLKAYIGYTKDFLNDARQISYSDLQLEGKDFLNMMLEISKLNTDVEFRKLVQIGVGNMWPTNVKPTTVNAFYNHRINSVYIPASILDETIFHKDRPRYINYGAIGTIIGHEITHGFDAIGKNFNENGDFKIWWSFESERMYFNKSKCIISQFLNHSSNFETINEDISDLGGIKQAYMAYKYWEDNNHPEPLLPGLKYNAKQLFWISAANVWCAKKRPKLRNYLKLLDNHSPTETRILRSLINIDEFSKDFNCPIGSKMNPKNKCTVW